MPLDLKVYLSEKKQLVEAFLESYYSTPFPPKSLRDSMVYSLLAGGKRVRPVLCLASYEACGGRAEFAVPQAAAIELIHTYSLIHDDLPAMDNDDLRRGKPTNHKVFGEGMAILAGDGLLTDAFCLLADKRYRRPILTDAAIAQCVCELAYAAGSQGMVGGQAQDLLSENAEPDPITLTFIHEHKTAALISVSVRMGAILAGADEDTLERLTRYGENIGIAFQVIDDILDVEGETEVIGKPKGSDEKKKKLTYPRLYGIAESRRKAKELIETSVSALSVFDGKAEPLRAVARYLYERKS
jgi:geranylgeranyl diphosphate synthase, type II